MPDWNIHITSDWHSCEDEWRRLEQSGTGNMFQSYDWISLWYQTALRHRLAKPVIVVATHLVESEATVILPLSIYSKFSLTIIGPPDHGVSDCFALLTNIDALSPNILNSLFTAVIRALPAHDLFLLARIDSHALDLSLLPWSSNYLRQNPVSAWQINRSESSGLLDHSCSSKLRKETQRKSRKLDRDHGREMQHHWPLSSPDLLTEILTLKNRQTTSKGKNKNTHHEFIRDLYMEVLRAGTRTLTPVATTLHSTDLMVAGQFGFVYRNTFVGLILCMEAMRFGKYSPGMQTALECLAKAQMHGVKTLDLSIGDQNYKRQLGCVPRELFTLVLPGSWKGRLAWSVWYARHMVRAFFQSLRSDRSIF